MKRSMILAMIALAVLTGVPGPLAAAQTPAAYPDASGDFDLRQLDVVGTGFAISPDGQWLAGVGPDRTPCFWDVESLTPQCAGEELPIMVHPTYPSMAWAPDGSAVVFALDAARMAYDSDIYIFERESGTMTNLTDDGYEGSVLDAPGGTPIDMVPTWSPDGQQIVFSRSVMQGDTSATSIMRVDRAGGEPAEVVTLDIEEPLVIWMPMHWLPDDTILYALSAAQVGEPRNGLWRVNVDGGTPEKILPGDGNADIPAPAVADVNVDAGVMSVFSQLLLAQFMGVPERPVFWFANLDDGELRPLPYYDADQGVTLDPSSVQPTDMASYPLLAFPAGPAAISPDGTSALVAYRNANGELSLVTLDVATGEVARIDPLPPGVRLQPVAPQWTDDGSVLLLTDGPPILLTVRPGVETASPVASPAASPAAVGPGSWRIAGTQPLDIDARSPVLSPDGSQMAGMDRDGRLCIWVTETLESTCVDEPLPIREQTIVWSPDGTAVAFALDAIRQFYESDIYVYEMATGELMNLTDDGVEGDLLDHFGTDLAVDDVPAWSPDSRELVFVRSVMGDEDPGTTTIMRIGRDGGEPAELLPLDVEQPFTVWTPMRWLADGTLLYAQSSSEVDDPRNGIWKVGVDDGASPIQIASGADDAGIPGAMLVGVDPAGRKAVVFSRLLASQFSLDSGQPLYWLVDIATGERVPFPSVPGVDGNASVPLAATYAPSGDTILFATLTDEGVSLTTMDPETLAVTPVAGAPLDAAPLHEAVLQWVASDIALLPAADGAVLIALEPAA